MKKLVGIVFIGLIAISSSLMASNRPEMIKLDNSRTSMEYGPQIRHLLNKIENYKWETDIGIGYHFVQTEAPYEAPNINEKIFVNVKTFFYGKLAGETLMYLVQSRYKGYIDVVDFSSSDRFAIKYSEKDNTIGLLRYGRPDDIYNNVEVWSENPNPVEVPGSEDDGASWVF